MVHTQEEGVGAHSGGPFAYSGYASEPRLREGPARGESRTELNDELDARSGYSAATVMDPTTLRAFIFELCQDIYGKALRCKVGYKNWPEMSAPLSDLVKDFALKIGQTCAPYCIGIMYFVHMNHR